MSRIGLTTVSKAAVMVMMALGVAMMVMGSVFAIMGLNARGDVRDALVKEQVLTS